MKRYIRNSYEDYEEDFYPDDLEDDDGSGSWAVELYTEKYVDPVYKHFSTGEKALQYAKKVQDRYEEIYINRLTYNGPSNKMVYSNGKWYGHL